MSFAQGLSTYLTLNLLFVVATVGLAVFSAALRFAGRRLDARAELKLHYAALTAIFFFTAIHPLLPRNDVFAPAVRVWSAPSIKSFSNEVTSSGYLSLPTQTRPSPVQTSHVTWAGLGFAFLLLLIGGLHAARDVRLLLRIRRGSFLIRRVGRVRIFVSDTVQVPFSYWRPGKADVILPSALLTRPAEYRMAIAHELQHHRHGDTRWVHILWGLRLACPLNPAVPLWTKWISEIQEFACDETLVDQNKVESQEYARCLVEVAQTALDRRRAPVCATGLSFANERNLLHRRIERMFSKSSTRMGRSIRLSMGLVLASILGATAFAAKSLIQDRRLSMDDAKAMAIRAQSQTGFPIEINDMVLQQLNRYLGTPEGRSYMRDALARMEDHQALIAGLVKKHGVPMELMAVPIVESAYQNLTEDRNPSSKAAGLWQFIPSTARNFGLRVDNVRDDRLDIAASTDAALRYLKANHLRFNDWRLAHLGYYIGEDAVQRHINNLNTRDPWTLVRNGHGDVYLPRLMAAVLIMKNPESVQ